MAAAPQCPTLKAAIVVTHALNDHQLHLGRKGGTCHDRVEGLS